jgi:ABC-type oligopeptide transport system ATPase subunit
MASSIVDVRNLVVAYPRGRRKAPFRAVDDVSFAIAKGETLGLVGESGSGKSTIGSAILGLAKLESGSIVFQGDDLATMTTSERRAISGHLQVVFQDPYSSLNPSRRIGQSLIEPLMVHTKLSAAERTAAAEEMLERVGLSGRDLAKYPAAFSGGQRQRIAIARALMTRPGLVICDEPVSGLDLSAQAQVLNLLRDLQQEMHLSMLFISHDLAVVRYMSSRIAVLRNGKIVEHGSTEQVCNQPIDPYTQRLLAAAPVPDVETQRQARRLRKQLAAERLADAAAEPEPERPTKPIDVRSQMHPVPK